MSGDIQLQIIVLSSVLGTPEACHQVIQNPPTWILSKTPPTLTMPSRRRVRATGQFHNPHRTDHLTLVSKLIIVAIICNDFRGVSLQWRATNKLRPSLPGQLHSEVAMAHSAFIGYVICQLFQLRGSLTQAPHREGSLFDSVFFFLFSWFVPCFPVIKLPSIYCLFSRSRDTNVLKNLGSFRKN